jgi:hypothetical protein
MFTFLIVLSLVAGLVISWIGWFGMADHDKTPRSNDL